MVAAEQSRPRETERWSQSCGGGAPRGPSGPHPGRWRCGKRRALFSPTRGPYPSGQERPPRLAPALLWTAERGYVPRCVVLVANLCGGGRFHRTNDGYRLSGQAALRPLLKPRYWPFVPANSAFPGGLHLPSQSPGGLLPHAFSRAHPPTQSQRPEAAPGWGKRAEQHRSKSVQPLHASCTVPGRGAVGLRPQRLGYGCPARPDTRQHLPTPPLPNREYSGEQSHSSHVDEARIPQNSDASVRFGKKRTQGRPGRVPAVPTQSQRRPSAQPPKG